MISRLSFFAFIIFALTSCTKKTDGILNGRDSVKTQPVVVKVPDGVSTTIGRKGASWVMDMYNLANSTGADKYSMATDAGGNIYIMMNYAGVLDLDPGTDYVAGAVFPNTSLVKYDATGKLLWTKLFKTANIARHKLKVDNTGALYCLLSCNKSPTVQIDNFNYTFKSISPAALVIKLAAASGDVTWTKEIGSRQADNGHVRLCDMAVDNANNIAVTGEYKGIIDFYDDNATTLKSTSFEPGTYFWAKYDAAGKFLIAKSSVSAPGVSVNYEGTNDDAIAFDKDQNIYLAGLTGNDNVYTVPLLGDNIKIGSGVGFITKYDKNGNWVWIRAYNDVNNQSAIVFTDVATDSNGNVYGFGNSTLTIGDVLWKLDTNGGNIWFRNITNCIANGRTHMVMDNKNQVLLTGDCAQDPYGNGFGIFNHAIYFYRYDAAGNLIYNKILGGYGTASYTSLINTNVDNAGNVNVFGWFNGAIKVLGTSADPVRAYADAHNSLFIAHIPDAQ